jgi:hypothetical protein
MLKELSLPELRAAAIAMLVRHPVGRSHVAAYRADSHGLSLLRHFATKPNLVDFR